MKWIVAVCLTVATLLAVEPVQGKSLDKGVHKKASSAKPTKTPKSVVEQFRGLPAEDYAFLEELDKQFQLHGDKIKIKVERDNTTQTTSGKNSKRTIDGSLSYGYHHNPHHPQHQFYFTKPRYEIYPYSQEDIPPIQHSYPQGNLHTSVEIQQSQGYEIKEVPQVYHAAYGHHSHFPQPVQQPIVEASPVIILKVPGPSKYASHLKTLLQQYLEIRAAQVIKELEEQEQAHYQQAPVQQQVQHYHIQQEPQQYQIVHVTPSSIPQANEDDHPYHSYRQHVNGHTLSTAQSLVEEPQAQQVYSGPTHQTTGAEHHQHQQQQYVQEIYEQPSQGPTVYEEHQVQYIHPSQQPSALPLMKFQQVFRQEVVPAQVMYVKTERPPPQQQHQQYVYANVDEGGQQMHEDHSQNGHAEQESNLETNENYPSEKHTRVIFTKNIFKKRPSVTTPTPDTHAQEEVFHGGPTYLPSAPPTPTVQIQHELYHSSSGHQQAGDPHDYQGQANTPGPFVTITQKRKQNRVPFNYHAHGRYSTPPPRPSNNKRESPFTEEQFQKFNKLVNRLKKKQVMLISERTKGE